jgi:hypothetical protein
MAGHLKLAFILYEISFCWFETQNENFNGHCNDFKFIKHEKSHPKTTVDRIFISFLLVALIRLSDLEVFVKKTYST